MKSFLAKYASHLAGYVVSAATIVSAINPKLLPPQYAFVTALAGGIVTAAHHGYTAGQLQAAASAAASALAKPATAAVLTLALVVGASGLTGCTTAQNAQVQAIATSPAAQVLVTAAVDAAVATAESKGITAAQINGVAKVALAADSGTGATVATVSAAANAELMKLNLPMGDLAAAQLLESLIGAEIQARLAADPTATANVASAQTDVAFVLNAVVAATGG